MSEQSYPNSCRFCGCGKLLYGPVNYCPYCSVPPVSPPVEEEDAAGDIGPTSEEGETRPEGEVGDIGPTSEEGETRPEGDAGDVAPASEEGETRQEGDAGASKQSGSNSNGGQNEKLEPRPGPWKWVAGIIVIATAIAGYLVFTPSQQGSGGSAGHMQDVTTSGVPQRESARILARETLSQGTSLSVAISNLPKLERVLEAAKKLAEISPRYQEQLTSAENTMISARNNRDKGMMAYIGKIIELGRYTPEEISYALEIVQNGDLTSREKIVAELLAEHVNSIRSGTKADPKTIHTNFTQRFSDFMD